MSEPWLAYLLIVVFVAIAVQQLQAAFSGGARDRKRAAKRLSELGGPVTATERDSLRRRASGRGRSALLARLDRLVLQSGTRASPARLGGAVGAVALIALILLPLPGLPLRLVASVGTGVLLVGLWLRLKRARRLRRFGEQLPEVIDVIVRSLRAGHPLPVSLALVAREMPEPAGPEFALVVDEVNYGRSLSEALENLYQRVGYPELAFFVASTSIASQTGGNLGEILSRLSKMLRERFRLTRRVRALTAEGRFSGYALSALPIILFGLINLVSASYYAEFWQSPSANTVLGAAIGLLLVGNLVIIRLVNFRV